MLMIVHQTITRVIGPNMINMDVNEVSSLRLAMNSIKNCQRILLNFVCFDKTEKMKLQVGDCFFKSAF